MDDLHSLLRRQLKRHFGSPAQVPPELEPLLRVIDSAYREFDADRGMLERSLDLSSQELLQANSEMRAIFQAIPDLLFRTDLEGRILDYKAGSESEFYAPPRTLTGKRIQDVPSPDAAEKLEAALAQARDTSSTVTIEYSLRVRGAEQYYEARFSPMVERQLIVMIRNITERKKMEARLLTADRMASVGTLSAGVAHEINNPLAYVITNLGIIEKNLHRLLAENPALGETLHDVREAKDGADRVRQIVRDLKAFSRVEETMNDSIDVRTVMETAIKLAWVEIRHRARLVREYRDVPLISANAGRLGQAFLNLLINAAQAIPEGIVGHHTVRVVTRTNAEGWAEIEVHDTGSGIKPELIDRIFEPFFTTKPVGVGTGLGLAICHGIVTGAGGKVIVESQVGAGSMFRIVLPAAEASARRIERRLDRRPSISSRVMILDDEPKIGVALARALEHEHDVVSLTSPTEALKRLESGEYFDVILCDLMMPEMTGAEFFARVEPMQGGVARKIVFITGGALTSHVRAFLDRVPNQRLEKPIDIDHLQEVIRELRTSGEGSRR